jgi:hypothetical protein
MRVISTETVVVKPELIRLVRRGDSKKWQAHYKLDALKIWFRRSTALQARADELAGKLDGQDAGKVKRGRKLSDSGAKARFFHEVADARLSRIIKVDLKSDLFTYGIDAQAQQRAELMDGKLFLVTNVLDLTPQEIVSRYKALADIERGFKVLKSEIEIAPVFHRLPERIKAHASLCFMALIV